MTQSIAGIRRRFFALILDILILGVLGGAVTFPLENNLNLDIDDLFESVQEQIQGSQAPAASSLFLVFILAASITSAVTFVALLTASPSAPS